MRFKCIVPSGNHSVTIEVPDGMTVNGVTSSLVLTTGQLYEAWLNATAGDWFMRSSEGGLWIPHGSPR
jgi:hypothetical protein